jgi:hypothetical protein
MSKPRATLLVLSLILAMPAYAAAQVPALEKGSWLIGGSASFTSEALGDDDRVTYISIAPRGQYFLTRGLALGGVVSLSRASFDDATTTSWAAGPAASYYFVQEGAVQPFVSGSATFGGQETDSSDTDRSFVAWEAGAGLLLLLNDAVGLDARLFYTRQDTDLGGIETDRDRYGLDIGVSAFVF